MQVQEKDSKADPSVQAASDLLADIDAEEEDPTGIYLCHLRQQHSCTETVMITHKHNQLMPDGYILTGA